MSQKKISKDIGQSSSSVWFLLLSVSGVMLFFKTDFYDPFNSAKLILLLVTTGWIIGHLVNSYRDRPIKSRSIEFITSVILLSFIICLLISTFLTDPFIAGLLGETQRRNGFLAYLCLSLILLFAARSIDFSNILRVYKTMILTGTFLCTYGLIQISGRDFVNWDNQYSDMIATVGNPNFASALLAVLSVLGIYGVVIKNLSNIFKLLSIYTFGGSLVAIIISGSRQGLLVIFFSTIFYLSIYSFLKNKKIGIFVSSILGFGGVLTILGMLQIGPLTAIVYKQSVSIRGYYWRAGIEMFKDSPLTGVGVDRYGSFFRFYKENSYSLKYGYDISSNNAHNTFIQLFATAGMFVGIFYLILLALIFFTGIDLLKKSNPINQKIILGILASWVGFQAQSLVSIDNLGISILGWLLGGSILGLKWNQEKKLKQSEIDKVIVKKSRQVKVNLFQPIISTAALVPILIFSTQFFNLERDLFILKGIADPQYPQNKEPVLQYVNKVLDNPSADPFYKYRTAFFLIDMGYSEEGYAILEKMYLNNPKNYDFIQGLIYLEESRNNLPKIISLREQISLIDPFNANNYFELLKLYKTIGELSNATTMKDKIFNLAPGTEIARSAIEILG